jgi:predicted amidohydrolase
MTRLLTVAAAQLGPIQKAEPRGSAVDRMVRLMERAYARGVQLVVFPELALTTFFPRHFLENPDEADHWFEETMPSNETAPLFAAARRYGIGFHLGYAEIAHEPDETGTPRRRHFNTSILVAPSGEILLKYRKVHLPGHADFRPERKTQHLEKLYFEVGNLGFPVIRAPMGTLDGVSMGMMICNDRRWPEAWRVLGLQSVELVMLGYNTPSLICVCFTAISRSRRAVTRTRPSRLRPPRRASRTATNCSGTRSSSTRRARSRRWRRVGATS